MSINNAVIVGRLTKDPELRKTTSGLSVCNFTIAADRTGKKDNNGNTEHAADFIPCMAWRQSADFLCKCAEKGSIVAVNGRIQTGSYQNQKGETVYTWNVNVQDLQVFSYKRDRQQNTADGNEYRSQAMTEKTEQSNPAAGSQVNTKQSHQMNADSLNWDADSLNISSYDLPF